MSTPASRRIIDLDVTRAVAMIGVVAMNYHGYLILDGGTKGTSFISRVFDPWSGPLSTRFAAVFVMVAGMGATLMTNRSRTGGDAEARSRDRWTLVRRGLALYAFGYVLDWIWEGTILFYYGAFFLAAAVLFGLSTRWLVTTGVTAALAGAGLEWWRFQHQLAGHSTLWLLGSAPRSPRGLLADTFVNGTHPLLPWLAFLCLGMILGRHLPLRLDRRIMLAFGGIVVTLASYAIRTAAGNGPLRAHLFATDPFSRSLVYTAGTVGSSVAAFCVVGAIAEATSGRRLTRALAEAGRMTLTIYVLHVLAFNLLVDWLGWIRPTGLDTALAFATGFWILAITAAAVWQERFGMGPLERIYRRLGGDAHPAQGSLPYSDTPISANVPSH